MNRLLQPYIIAYALLATGTVSAVLLSLYLTLEPAVVSSQVTRDFTVSQSITGEISFEADPNDVTLSPTIPGITGGTATGTTFVRVSTNNPAGYTLDVNYEDTVAMNQNTGAATIPNLGVAVGSAVYDLTPTATEADFAMTASSASVVSALLDDGASSCGSGSPSLDNCWFMPADATGAVTIVDRASDTSAAGERTDLAFKVVVGANPDPTLPIDTYKATATLTATENP